MRKSFYGIFAVLALALCLTVPSFGMAGASSVVTSAPITLKITADTTAAADGAVTVNPGVEAASPATVGNSPSLLTWYAANEKLVLRIALSISELLALLGVFKGNGILHTLLLGGQNLIVSRQKQIGEDETS